VRGFQNLVALAVDNFNGLFKEVGHMKMDVILKQLVLFPHRTSNEDNDNYIKKSLLKKLGGFYHPSKKKKAQGQMVGVSNSSNFSLRCWVLTCFRWLNM
jgi:hypothetical protein